MNVWLNGEFIEIDAAKVSAFDAGFQHGVGVFETMRAAKGRVLDLDDHLQRMSDSAKALRLSERMRLEPLAEAVVQTLKRSGLEDARIRVTVSGGDLNLLREGGASQDPTILIVVQPPTQYPNELYEKGVTVTVCETRVNPTDEFSGHKTLWYWPRLLELQRAAAQGASESLWFDLRNMVGCGCVSNVLIVEGDKLVAPRARGEEPAEGDPRPSGVLPGIVRSNVLEWASQEGLEVLREDVDASRLLQANEVMLTNSGWGIMPVVAVEDNTISGGIPGEFTMKVIERWRERLALGA